MNNSLNYEEEVSQRNPTLLLKEREAKLVRMIEALAALGQSPEWSTLKHELFDEIADSIEKRTKDEATKPDINSPELYRLQGEKRLARKYDLPKLLETYRIELANIRKQIKPPELSGL